MTYNPSIPQPDDDMSVSQGDLNVNFGQLNTIFGEDHQAFDATSNKGKHKKVHFVEQTPDPKGTTDSFILFSKEDDNNNTEIFGIQESTETPFQFTKLNELYVKMHPVFAVNLTDTAPDGNTGAGTYNFNVQSNFNLDTALTYRATASKCHYRFYFTNPVLDPAGVATNQYMFYANGFANTSNPIIGKVPNTATYGNKVDSTFIEIEFVNQSNSQRSSMTGATIFCWRVQ